MKRLLIGTMLLSAGYLGAEEEISLAEINKVFSLFTQFTDAVIKINPGDELPLNFRLEGDVLGLVSAPEHGRIKALQPLYIKVEPSFLFSTDKKEWNGFESFFTGMLGASFSGKDEGSSGEIYLDINKRK